MPQNRAFKAESIDLRKEVEIHWLLKRPGPNQKELRYKIFSSIHELDRQPFDPDYPETNPIWKLPDFIRAKAMLERHIREKSRIIIYGDFDCDGVTSISLMRDMLRACYPDEKDLEKALVSWLIPPRLTFGYGLHWDFIRSEVRRMNEIGEAPGLVIAVDCGSSHIDDIKKILQANISVLVVDHHEPNKAAINFHDGNFAHLNPKLLAPGQKPDPDVEPLKDLCAAGLVYMIAEAIVGGVRRWDRDRALLLAGLATYVDVVPLRGINRWLVKASTSRANQPEILKRVPGLFLMARRPRPRRQDARPVPPAKDIYYHVDENTYGFEWGPRLNAPGRMGSALTALNLLLPTQGEDAKKMQAVVAECKKMNQWRRATNDAIEEMAILEAQKKMNDADPTVLLLCNATWHPGVVGIVASRIKDRFQRPTIVCAKSADGYWRGSGRSVKSLEHTPYDMGKKFQEACQKGAITKGGGHPMAGGLTFSRAQFRRLEKWLDKNSGLQADDFKTRVKAYASPSVFSPREWWNLFERLRPFGSQNPCPPLIVERAELQSIRVRTKMPHDYYYDQEPEAEEEEDGYVLGDGDPVEKYLKRAGKADGPEPEAIKSSAQPREMNLADLIFAAKPRPKVWAYEGVFLDLATQKNFFAHWLNLEMAEHLWDVKKFLVSRDRYTANFKWNSWFKLELQLQAFIPSARWAAVKRGAPPEWDYDFRIKQCLPISRKQK